MIASNLPFFLAFHSLCPLKKPLFELLNTAFDGDWKSVFGASEKKFLSLFSSIPKPIEIFLAQRKNISPFEIFDTLQKYDIQTLILSDPQYPALLAESSDPPVCLFYKGNIDILSDTTLSIVGSRSITSYGKQVLDTFFETLPSSLSIVSGFALGTDTYAHQRAFQNNARTICVLGNGLDTIYPRQNEMFARQLLETQIGLFVSEYFPHTPALPHHFPARNRIVASLSSATLVVEAREKSGSLITARLALEENREVFAVPGSLFSAQSQGCHQIIAKGEATAVYKAQQIIDIFGYKPQLSLFSSEKKERFSLPFSDTEKTILDYLKQNSSQSCDDITRATNMPSHTVNATLTFLQIKGVVRSVDSLYSFYES